MSQFHFSRITAGLAAVTMFTSCRPADILKVPAPLGVVSAASIATQSGAEMAFDGGKSALFQAVASSYGLLRFSGVLSDEFVAAGFAYGSGYPAVDARMTSSVRWGEPADQPWQSLLGARSSLLTVLPDLVSYEPASSQSKVGEAYALVGYTEVLLAEDYCAGTPLDRVLSTGGVSYGTPLATDSLFGQAQADFDSALAHANSDPTVTNLATIGLARALLDRGNDTAAARVAAAVPTGFVYNIELQPTTNQAPYSPDLYEAGIGALYYRGFNVADREGTNGLNFLSADDPRLTIDSSRNTADGTPWYVPAKFTADVSDIPLATGIEARLIEAEAALATSPSSTAWADDLSALRADTADTHVMFDTSQVPVKTDSTTDLGASARVDFLFRERAFWLFGTTTRLGDLRRLVRQYQRPVESVYPTGTYLAGPNDSEAYQLNYPIPTYGTDVSLTVPTAVGYTPVTNPNYKGCLTSAGTA